MEDLVRFAQEQLKKLGFDPGPIDGIYGIRTQRALVAYHDSLIPSVIDERTEANIKTLNAKIQPLVRRFILKLLQHGFPIKIISGTRTFAEQDALYEQGRTKPGPIVTNARGGYSNHNFGVAFDLGVFRNGKYLDSSQVLEDRKYVASIYSQAGVIAKEMGLAWGGDWQTISDYPHFEYPTGYTLAQMREMVKNGQSVV